MNTIKTVFLSILFLGISILVSVYGLDYFYKNEVSQDSNNRHVIVVGAGISGLAAAHELKNAGIDVVVLEAKETIGGRIQTQTLSGTHFEIGASWIHGDKNNPVADILKNQEKSLVLTSFKTAAVYKNGKRIVNEEALPDETHFFEAIEEFKNSGKSDMSLKDIWSIFIQDKGKEISPDETVDLLHFLSVDIETENGASLQNISALQYDEDKAMEGGDKLVVGGYDAVIKFLAKNLDIRLRNVVNRIEDFGDRVQVTTTRGDILYADDVIVTVPLGVLQKGNLTFVPGFPAKKQKAIESLKMGNLHKTFFVFPEKFWDDVDTITILNENDTRYADFINLEPVFKKPILLALHAGSDGDALKGISENQMIDEAYKKLTSIYPHTQRPIFTMTSKWHADQFTLGSYSYIPPGATIGMYDDIAEPYGNIHFAGEHTNSMYPSTTHGAYLSGIRAAHEIITK